MIIVYLNTLKFPYEHYFGTYKFVRINDKIIIDDPESEANFNIPAEITQYVDKLIYL